jgi:hypothetical protein
MDRHVAALLAMTTMGSLLKLTAEVWSEPFQAPELIAVRARDAVLFASTLAMNLFAPPRR